MWRCLGNLWVSSPPTSSGLTILQLVVKTGSLGALWQRCLIRLHNWEIIFVSAMSPISCGTTLQNKQLKDVERLSPLFFFEIMNRVQGGGTSNRHAQHPRPPFQIWQACGGCSSSPWVSEGCWNSDSACNEHRQKAKSWRLSHPGMNYENIDDLGCFLASLWPFAAATHSNALCFSDTQWQQLRQWWGSKMSLNHVEPCWTLPLRNATFDCLERPCSNTAPASAITSESGNTCRKPSSKDSKVWHSEIQCFNMFQWFSMIFNVCLTCTRWHVKVSGSFMFSWNYWLITGMSYESSKIPWRKVQTWVLEGW